MKQFPIPCLIATLALFTVETAAQQTAVPSTVDSLRRPSNASVDAAQAVLPPGYVIGPQDVLSIVFWREKDMSADVVVRPDGKISLPLLNDIQAAGLTPEQLRREIGRAAAKYVEDPVPSVVVKEIHSRNVFITGNVVKPGTYVLGMGLNVVQLIALAGGFQEYANRKNIVIFRKQNGSEWRFRFNYNDFLKQRNVEQNVVLGPGDTVIVP